LYPTGASKSMLQSVSMMQAASWGWTSLSSVIFFGVVRKASEISFGDATVIAQGMLQHRPWIDNLQKFHMLGLKFDIGRLGQTDIRDRSDHVLLNQQSFKRAQTTIPPPP